MTGYFLLWRRFFEHPYWTERRVFSRAEAWIDIVNMAAFGEHERMVGAVKVRLRRGELIASDRFLERRWRWSRGKVRRFVAGAIESQELVREREVNGGCSQTDTTSGTIYRVVKYDDYQPRDTSDGTTNGPPTVPAAGQRELRVSKGKKEQRDTGLSPVFLRAWQEYPGRAGGNSRVKAWQAWCARVKDGASEGELLAGTIRYRDYCHAEKMTGTRYVMQASRFYGPGLEYQAAWKPEPPESGRVREGTEAAAARQREELPRSTEPRTGAPESTAERDQRMIADWERAHGAEAKALMAKVVADLRERPEWSTAEEQFFRVAAKAEYRRRVLAQASAA